MQPYEKHIRTIPGREAPSAKESCHSCAKTGAALGESLRGGHDARGVFAISDPLQGCTVDLEGSEERCDRGEEALLEPDEGELRKRGLLAWQAGDPLHPELTVGGEPTRELGGAF